MKVILRVMKGPKQTILSPYNDENALGVAKGPTQIILSLFYQRNALGLVTGPTPIILRASSDRMLLEHEGYYGLGMDAPVTVCSRNTNVIMVWA